MGRCKCVLLFLLAFIALILIVFGNFEGRYFFFKTLAKLDNAGYLSEAVGTPLLRVTLISTIVACKGDYGICGRAELGQFFTRLGGPDVGYSPGFGHLNFVVDNHATYLDWIYSTELRRDPNIFIGAKLDQIHDGIIPHNTVLNLGTGDPEHTKRRQLISDAVGALARHPSRPTLITPGWAEKTGDEKIIMRLTGLNIFNWMFDIKLEDMHLDMLMEFNAVSGPIALGLGAGDQDTADTVQHIIKTLKAVIGDSQTGKNFVKMSDSRGYNTDERLTELTAVLMFAGFGGTSAYAVQTIERIRSDPALYVPMYLKDKVAFLKESARLNPPVGGIVLPSHLDMDVTMGGDMSGKQVKFSKDDLGVLWIPNANKDPKVFGGPDNSAEYALKFDPTRENLNKIMTWNGLLDDIENGYAPVPGTKGHAPRACPGAIFAIQIVEKVVDYFLPTADGKHTEL
jgi:hypothetical protein